MSATPNESPRSGRPSVPPRIPRYGFEPEDRIVIDGEEYEPESDDEFEHRLIRVRDGMRERFSHATIESLRNSGSLQVRHGAESDARARLRHIHGGDIVIRDLPEDARRKVFFRKSICDWFLRLEDQGLASKSDAALRPVIREAHAAYCAEEIARQTADGRCGTSVDGILNPPSPPTLRNWLRRYEKGAYEAAALLDWYGKSGNRTPRLQSKERELLEEFAKRYASRLQPTMATVYEDLDREIERLNAERAASGERLLRLPSRKAFERAVKSLDRWFVLSGRLGPEAARKKLHIVNGGVRAFYPLDRIEMDEWSIPLHVIAVKAGLWERMTDEQRKKAEKKRVWLSTAIDVATRCFLAARIIPAPSAASALATLQMSVTDKSDFAVAAGCETAWDMGGVGSRYVTDGGSAYMDEFKAAVIDLRAEPTTTPSGLPQMRGTQERAFRTLHSRLISRLDGRAFENVVARGDYDAVGNASLDEDELGKAIVRFIVDYYHNDPHDGLGGETPRHAWLRMIALRRQRTPPNSEDCRNIFGVTMKRAATNRGIELLGLHYQSTELQQMRRKSRKQWLVRFDPFDLGCISVSSQNEWLPVPCVREDMEGVTAAAHLAQLLRIREANVKAADEVKGTKMRALRDIVDLAARASERGNIASPIMSGRDFESVARDVSRDFTRGDESGAPDVLALAEPTEPTPPERVSDDRTAGEDPHFFKE